MKEAQAKAGPCSELFPFEVFFDRNPFAFFIMTAGHGIVKVNAFFEQITGYDINDLQGLHIEDILSRKNSSDLYGYHRAKLAHKDRPFQHECLLTCKDGAEIRVVINMNIVTSEALCLGALQDVSKERCLASELAEKNLILKKSADRLRSAQEELHRVTELTTLGEISGRIAHELLNPLTGVNAKVKYLIDRNATLSELASFLGQSSQPIAGDPLRDTQVHTLGLIEKALHEHQKNVDESLSFLGSEISRIQNLVNELRNSGRKKSIWSRHRLLDVLEYCQEVMTEPLNKQGVLLDINCPSEIHVRGDKSELIQILTNIFRNAIQALSSMPPGQNRHLKIGAFIQRNQVEIRIDDSGPGIPEDIELLIFEPDFTTKDTGTGFGLSIARRLARVHSGDLVLDRTYDKGCRFILTLPCSIGPSVAWEG